MTTLLTAKDVAKRTTLSPVLQIKWAKQGLFPPPFRLIRNRNVWIEEEIENWIRMKIKDRTDLQIKKEIARMVKARKE